MYFVLKPIEREGAGSLHWKKRLEVFPSPAGISLTKLWFVTSRLWTGKLIIFVYSVSNKNLRIIFSLVTQIFSKVFSSPERHERSNMGDYMYTVLNFCPGCP
jgi:hypothetical protein